MFGFRSKVQAAGMGQSVWQTEWSDGERSRESLLNFTELENVVGKRQVKPDYADMSV
jgi:hypothetical protein